MLRTGHLLQTRGHGSREISGRTGRPCSLYRRDRRAIRNPWWSERGVGGGKNIPERPGSEMRIPVNIVQNSIFLEESGPVLNTIGCHLQSCRDNFPLRPSRPYHVYTVTGIRPALLFMKTGFRKLEKTRPDCGGGVGGGKSGRTSGAPYVRPRVPDRKVAGYIPADTRFRDGPDSPGQ